ncbi:RNA polymerase sigma factor [Peristeroidobacter soli]|jgi:RNA polymerase sigma-70 factor (ECF subfamily)|uniref:RNA polymerase sigma factor n=1 Tax=Peristeroidobacter soli TaxID=2497877 RepID=UPI0013002EF2|nr:sigma-70 family RNA polymerase sigma factor [Peristeroidobacter soli]
MHGARPAEPTDKVDWDAVYADQLPRIYNYFRFRLGRAADVEDLTARTFEKAWSARSRYRRDLAGFSTWLFRIAQNVGTDHLRARRPHAPLDMAAGLAAELTPESQAARDSDLSRLGRLTARLPEREQDLIALKYGAALNNREIARLTGLSESNVGTLLYRLVQTLRSQW